MNGQFDLGAVTPVRYFFGIAVVLGLLFAFTSTGENEENLLASLLQWQLQAVGLMACLVGAHVLLLRWSWFEGRTAWLQLTLSGVAGSVAFAPVGLFLDIWLGGETIAAGTWLAEIADELLGVAPPAIVCWVAINAPWLLGFRIERLAQAAPAAQQARPAQQEEAGPVEAGFLALLPEEIRGAVIYLQAELHYITVATVHGRALILYNLRDAIKELEGAGVVGLHCHRSFWVAEEFVQSLRKRGRQGELVLANGDSVPVSRRSMESVAARWG